MSCEKHGYTNNTYCPACDLETISANTPPAASAAPESANTCLMCSGHGSVGSGPLENHCPECSGTGRGDFYAAPTVPRAGSGPIDLAQFEGHTHGPWQVEEARHPFMLNGAQHEHIEYRIFTAWDHPQMKGPLPVIAGSVGIGMEPGKAVHMTGLKHHDANLVAAAPSLLAELTRLRARVSELEKDKSDFETISRAFSQQLTDQAAQIAAMRDYAEQPPQANAVREYIDARNAYEDATKPLNSHGSARHLPHCDSIKLRYVTARRALDSFPRHTTSAAHTERT